MNGPTEGFQGFRSTCPKTAIDPRLEDMKESSSIISISVVSCWEHIVPRLFLFFGKSSVGPCFKSKKMESKPRLPKGLGGFRVSITCELDARCFQNDFCWFFHVVVSPSIRKLVWPERMAEMVVEVKTIVGSNFLEGDGKIPSLSLNCRLELGEKP